MAARAGIAPKCDGRHILSKPGHRILVVNGAGQQGLWEDVAGHLGDIDSVRAFRAATSRRWRRTAPRQKRRGRKDKTLEAWLIWTIWQKANPTLADQVAVEPSDAIFRDTGVALTKRGETRPEAKQFVAFLASAEGAAIFRKWGWIAPAN
jgi:accessory colonization factor AcfC